MTSRPIIRIHNAETGEILDREMNDLEFAQFQADQADIAAKAKAKEDAAIAKAALLDRLGLTEEEAKLLLS